MPRFWRQLAGACTLGAALLVGASPAGGQQGGAGGEWRSYAADVGGSKYSPLDQIGLMSQAEAVASYHGAGFTNMLYAAPDAQIVELGTVQTGSLRIGDFCAFAHAAEAAYHILVGDHVDDGPDLLPNLRGNRLLPVRLSPDGIGRFLAYVDGLLQDSVATSPKKAKLAA